MQALQHSICQGVRSPTTCRLLALLKTKLTWIPSLLSYPHLTNFVARLFAGCPCFHLKNLVGLAVGLAIKWLAAFPFSATGPSCQRLSYHRSSHQRLSHRGSGLLESDYRESSYCKSSYQRSSHRGLGPLESYYRKSSYCRSSHQRSSHRKSSHHESGPSESDYCESSYRRSTYCGSTYRGLSHRKCDINKR